MDTIWSPENFQVWNLRLPHPRLPHPRLPHPRLPKGEQAHPLHLIISFLKPFLPNSLKNLPYLDYKMGHSQSLFLYFRLFNTVDSKQMFNISFCEWLDSNHRPLLLEATALPTEPQSLPNALNGVPMVCTEKSAEMWRPPINTEFTTLTNIVRWQ